MTRALLVFAASLVLFDSAPSAQQSISAVQLGVPATPRDDEGNPGRLHAVAINAAGTVVGRYEMGGYMWAFTWTRARGFTLVMENAAATDINDHGDIVGHFYPCPPPLPEEGSPSECLNPRGFLLDADTGFVDLGGLRPEAINNAGRIAGVCGTASHYGCARINGSLRFLARRFLPWDVNDRGVIAGTYRRLDGVVRAAVWTTGTGLEEIEGPEGSVWAINDAGMMAGYLQNRTGWTAAAWTMLGPVAAPRAGESNAQGISDRGWLVGSSSVPGSTAPIPTLWRIGWTAQPLPLPTGARGGSAEDANDAGQIIGNYRNAADLPRAVLWTVK